MDYPRALYVTSNLAFDADSERAQQRTSMFLAAVLRSNSQSAPARIRNLSPSGAMIESSITPAVGSTVTLSRGSLIASAIVAWSLARKCGVRFSSEVSVQEWLTSPSTNSQQQRVDSLVAIVKDGRAGFRETNSPPMAIQSNRQLSRDLGSVVTLLMDLENDLSASKATLERHAVKLQNLDIAMQMLRAIAGELAFGTASPGTGVSRLPDLRVSCEQALLTQTDACT